MKSRFNFLRPLTPEEYEGLKANIELHGQRSPISYDQDGAILDGHHRARILRELGVPEAKWKKQIEELPDDDAKIAFVLSANVHRRQSTKEDRKRVAEHLYGLGWTMQRIAAELGVHTDTISDDLKFSDFPKTPRPKGGRPKGSARKARPRKNTEAAEQRAAKLVLDEGKSYKQAAAEAGIDGTEQVMKAAVAREQGRRELHVEASDLSLSARAKADAYLRRREREIRAECEQEANARYREHLARYLPELEKRESKARDILDRHKGLIPRAKYNKLLKAVHRDRINAATPEELDEAARILMELEHVLVSREKPLERLNFPRTWQEWEAAREAVRRKNSERAKAAHARKASAPAAR